MDKLEVLISALRINSDKDLDDIINKLKKFDIAALQTDVEEQESIDNENDILALCDRFNKLDVKEEGVYLEHVSGNVLFIPFSTCRLDHNKRFGNKRIRWTITF